MAPTIWRRIPLIILLTLVMGGVLSLGVASAEEPGGLVPSFGGGKLAISGSGFMAGEQVTITVDVNGSAQQVTTTADPQGRFQIETGLAVPPGASLKLDARGDKGTVIAAITSVPPEIVRTPLPLNQLPRTGGPNLLIAFDGAAGLTLVGTGIALINGRVGARNQSEHF